MSKKWMGVGLAILALVIAGCGGSSNHTSEWSKTQVASAESEINNSAPSISSTGRACYLKGIEADFPPSVLGQSSANGADREKLLKILAGCGYTAPSTSTSSSSNGGETYGPACKQQLESAACAEEQEKKAGAAIQQGEVNREKEEKEENQEAEEEKKQQENPTG